MKPEMWWTDTWNPVVGCSAPVSPGCDNCWARAMHRRFHKGESFAPRLNPNAKIPKKPGRVFVCNTGDLFDHDVPQGWIERTFDLMQYRQDHRFLVLTKQSERMYHYVMERFHRHKQFQLAIPQVAREWSNIMGHIWLGVSAESQEWYNARTADFDELNRVVNTFVSLEPLLGPIRVMPDAHQPDAPGWVVVGAETGPGKRFCDPKWMSSIVTECLIWGIPVFVKAIHLPTKSGKFNVSTNMAEWPEDIRVREYPKELIIGKEI